MPSPIGHALAGVATAWAADGLPGPTGRGTERRTWALTIVCAVLAALPDINLLYPNVHRRATHSVTAVIVTTIIAGVVTGWVTRRFAWRVALICGAAYGTHLVLDWLGADPWPPHGIQVFWPFSDTWYLSSVTIFPGTERHDPLSLGAILTNAKAAIVETAVLAPVLALIAFVRGRTRTQGTGR